MNDFINDVAKGAGKGSKKSRLRVIGEKAGKAVRTGVRAVKTGVKKGAKAVRRFFSRKR